MPPSPRSPRSTRALEEQRLSVIAEDGDAHISGSGIPPPVPPRSTHRPFARRWKDAPPRASSELEPPEYSTFDESKYRRDRLAELRDRPGVTRRGGWKRLLVIIVTIIILLALAIGVGLGVGLNRSPSGDAASGNSSLGQDTSTQSFPSGKFSIGTFLDSVETNCTSISSTFRCFPYLTYRSSGSQAATNFNWIIAGSGPNYTISSSDNPFAITFENVSLILQDADKSNERYTFSTKMNKVVIPSSPITDDNSQVECYFNGTTLSAALYTKMNSTNFQTYNITGQDSSAWNPWPFAAEVHQTITGGQDVPACYVISNGAIGTRVTSGLSTQPTSSECGCNWRNFDL